MFQVIYEVNAESHSDYEHEYNLLVCLNLNHEKETKTSCKE